MKNGESAEIAVVGNEGVVGVSLFMGGGSTSSRALVQSAGKPAADLNLAIVAGIQKLIEGAASAK